MLFCPCGLYSPPCRTRRAALSPFSADRPSALPFQTLTLAASRSTSTPGLLSGPSESVPVPSRMVPAATTATLPPGSGQIHLLPFGRFSRLSFCYPLKLLSPTPLPSSPAGLRVVYLLSYGGGLVGGDRVWIDVGVEQGARLVLLTQVRSPSTPPPPLPDSCTERES